MFLYHVLHLHCLSLVHSRFMVIRVEYVVKSMDDWLTSECFQPRAMPRRGTPREGLEKASSISLKDSTHAPKSPMSRIVMGLPPGLIFDILLEPSGF